MLHSLTIAQILQRPLFTSAKLVGGIQGVNRKVSWVHILYIENPRNFLHGGELILTTGNGFAQTNDVLTNYVEQLILAHAAGLCIELGPYIPHIPQSIIRLADQHDFPIIIFPNLVKFVDMTRDIHELIVQTHSSYSLKEYEMIQESRLVESLLRGEDVATYHPVSLHARPLTYGVLAISTDQSLELEHFDHMHELHAMIHSIFKKFFSHVILSIQKEHVIIIVDRHHHFQTWTNRIEQSCQLLAHDVEDSEWVQKKMSVGVGTFAASAYEITRSYTTALEALAIQRKLGRSNLLFYEQAGIYRYIAKFTDNHLLLQMATTDLEAIEEYDRKNEANLLFTLKMYLDCDRSKQQTANALYIHRQTLYHRLEHVKQLLICDLEDPIQRLALHVAIYTREFHMM